MNMGLTAGGRQAAVVFIAITVVIDVLGFGVIIPVLPRLVLPALLLAVLLPKRAYAVMESVA